MRRNYKGYTSDTPYQTQTVCKLRSGVHKSHAQGYTSLTVGVHKSHGRGTQVSHLPIWNYLYGITYIEFLYRVCEAQTVDNSPKNSEKQCGFRYAKVVFCSANAGLRATVRGLTIHPNRQIIHNKRNTGAVLLRAGGLFRDYRTRRERRIQDKQARGLRRGLSKNAIKSPYRRKNDFLLPMYQKSS
jgi:hypothetical protein